MKRCVRVCLSVCLSVSHCTASHSPRASRSSAAQKLKIGRGQTDTRNCGPRALYVRLGRNVIAGVLGVDDAFEVGALNLLPGFLGKTIACGQSYAFMAAYLRLGAITIDSLEERGRRTCGWKLWSHRICGELHTRGNFDLLGCCPVLDRVQVVGRLQGVEGQW